MGEAEELLKHLRAFLNLPDLEERVATLERKIDQLLELEQKRLEAYEAMPILQALRRSHPGVKIE